MPRLAPPAQETTRDVQNVPWAVFQLGYDVMEYGSFAGWYILVTEDYVDEVDPRDRQRHYRHREDAQRIADEHNAMLARRQADGDRGPVTDLRDTPTSHLRNALAIAELALSSDFCPPFSDVREAVGGMRRRIQAALGQLEQAGVR